MVFQLTNANLGYKQSSVLRNISLEINEGERVALVGESGAGKSTLLAALQAQMQNKAALIPQDLGLVNNLSVFHNIYIGRLNSYSSVYNLLNLAWPQRREVQKIKPLVEQLGLVDKLFKPTGELSGGQQQRTAICRALFQGGSAIIGDEPVSAVDKHMANIILKTLIAKFTTVVLAMHDVDLAIKFSTRIIGIKDSAICFDQSTIDLTRQDLDFLYQR
ncbi:MAG: ATP-binding cassette domain-containing protein [Rhodospirillaceae bacterium]|nr:ATP-binding cassette domain-containing protein [Rhodospirillaceae bacterium]MBT6305837.1 ATP-binding cassette domain-containing protein [Rhodospirillaceae bacterium]MBT7731946.1 ATP-binding cassette domain-containing protein [Rhodospirillaceae bacterium]